MPFSFPFFRSQSNLLSNKKDNLQQSAAEDSKLRFDYEKGRQMIKEGEMKKAEIEFYNKKFDFNLKEIDRRREAIEKLDLEEKGYQNRMDKIIQGNFDGNKEIEKNMKVSEGLDKKIERIQVLRRHYNSEITRLEEQNINVTKKLN